jgi:predicted ArsR family transcriptional regulator
MNPDKISDDLLALLKLIETVGESICVGTCEHRKPGELHCLNISQALKISSSGAKNRLRKLVQLGMLNRDRLEREEDGKVMAVYTLSPQGRAFLGRLPS